MPSAPRIKGKAKKLAYKIMGVPPNMKFSRNSAQRAINKRLVFEETQRVR